MFKQKKDAPEIAQFLTDVAINPEDLNGIIKVIEKDKVDPTVVSYAALADFNQKSPR